MTRLFANLKLFQAAEFLVMLALAFVIPFHWLAAQYGEVALVTCAVLKVVFEQKFKLNPSQMRWKWVYLVFMATWLVYLIGMFYTENADEGWFQVSKKLGFLFFPLVFLISDMSYLTKDRIRAVFYAFAAGCIAFFLMNLSAVIIGIIAAGGEWSIEHFFYWNLLCLYPVNHIYIAMYCVFAIAFLVNEIFYVSDIRLKIMDVISVVILMLFVVLADSRAGLLCLVFVVVMVWLWLTFVIKNRKAGTIIAAIILILTVVTLTSVPRITYRIRQTITDISSEKSSDHRIVQMKGYSELLRECWAFGVGTGDRTDETLVSYMRYKEHIVNQIKRSYDCHLPDEEFVIRRQEFVNDVLALAKQATNYEIHENIFKYLHKAKNHEMIDIESASKVLPELQFIQYAIDYTINAHNQFFETLISGGVIAVLQMLAMFVIPIVIMYRKRVFDMVFVAFLLIIGINAMFESVFEGQVGIIFFNFFCMLLLTALVTDKSLSVKVMNEKTGNLMIDKMKDK